METHAYATDEQEREAIQDALKELIQRQKVVTFIDPEGEFSTDERALGVMLARLARWTPGPIIQIAAEALEDANFTDLAEAVRKV